MQNLPFNSCYVAYLYIPRKIWQECWATKMVDICDFKKTLWKYNIHAEKHLKCTEHSDIQHPDSEILPAPVKHPCSAFAEVGHHSDFSLHRPVLPYTAHRGNHIRCWLVGLGSFLQHRLWTRAVSHSFILFAFPYSVVETLKFIYCARALRYVFCCLTLRMFLPMSFGGRMCVWWVHTSISARFGPKGPHAKLKVPAFLNGYQLAHRQCRLPAACILAKTWLFMLFILTISVDV